jgi:hypothetical protein
VNIDITNASSFCGHRPLKTKGTALDHHCPVAVAIGLCVGPDVALRLEDADLGIQHEVDVARFAGPYVEPIALSLQAPLAVPAFKRPAIDQADLLAITPELADVTLKADAARTGHRYFA